MNKNELKPCGRPPGKRKTAKLEISLEPDIKTAFMDICYEEGTNASVQLYQFIREYIKQHEKEELR